MEGHGSGARSEDDQIGPSIFKQFAGLDGLFKPKSNQSKSEMDRGKNDKE